MLRLNLFSVLEKLPGLTQETIANAVNEVADHMESNMENYIKTRIAGEIMATIANKFKDDLVADDQFKKATWNGVTVSRRSGTSRKSYDDPELDQFETELKQVQAKIKARKTYLDAMGQVTITRGSDTLTMSIPK